MIITTKLVSICLGLGLTAFTISTIVLAVQKASLSEDLSAANTKIDQLEDALRNNSTPQPPTESTPKPDPPPKIDYRLPTAIKPIHYDLRLVPDITTEEFSGTNVITIHVQEPTNKIILHSLNLQITSVEVSDSRSKLPVKEFTLDPVREFLVIELINDLVKEDVYDVAIQFSGTMKNKIVGLYSSSYLKHDGSRKTIATSKFEPTYARQAFPCFDEPGLKALFTVTLVHPADGDYNALSNMNVGTRDVVGETVEVHFNQSVEMSTYLACFIVSDFQEKNKMINTGGLGDDFPMRVFATPEQLNKVDYSLDVGVGITEYYIRYFQIPYPLPKLDMAAIPDFVSGAMEHWGLVTFRETSLLYDADISSTANKQRIASVVAHELAHMWFGNLVTMKWWNDLWLNEGFASYMEFKGVNSVHEDWKMHDQFIIATLHGVLDLDATLASHPIVQTVENPDQITELFDTITYSKGSSIIRMLEDFLTPAKFQEAVTNYLKKFAYKNAVTDDFLSEIEALDLGFDVKHIMRTWTEQMGLPVVQVTKVSETEYKLTQKRFLANPEDEGKTFDDSPFNYKWSIPITYVTADSADVQREWFYYDQPEVIVKLDTATKWIKFNRNQVGYYRVNYDPDMWKSLIDELFADLEHFTPSDRAHLMNDAFALADATQLPYETALDITKYLKDEVEYVPWSVAASKLTSLKNTLMFTDAYQNFATYSRKLIEKAYKEVTWTVGTDHLKNRLRVTILSASCSLGLEDCLKEAANKFDEWLREPTARPNPDLREIIYYYGLFNSGSEASWEKMWELFIAEQDASEKSKLMYGLSGIQVPWILNKYIDLAWDERNVRGQDYFTCLQYIAANRIGEGLVWNYVRENWEKLVDRFTLNERYLGSLIPAITSRFDSRTRLEEMEHFFEKYPEAGAGTAARKRALENVKNNIKWLEENKDNVGRWLAAQV